MSDFPTKKTQDQKDKLAKYIVAGMSVIGLVIVVIYDLQAEENVPQLVYGIFAGGIIGAEAVTAWFKK